MDADHVIGRLVFGVGSRLATSHGDPSLDGVFKLVAVDDGTGAWTPAIKRSDSPVKVLNPGAKRLWRVYDERGQATADVLSTAAEALAAGDELHLHHHARPDVVAAGSRPGAVDELLVPGRRRRRHRRRRRGRRRWPTSARPRHAGSPTSRPLDPGVRRLVNPHTYHVSITDDLFDLKQSMLSSF